MLEMLRERIRSILFGRIKLPGWAAILFAIITGIPDWKSRLDFWLGAVVAAGGYLGMVAAAIASPYFSPGLALAGLAYLLFVGEPKKGVQRHPWWPYVGWSIVSICFAATALTAIIGGVQISIKQQVGQQIQEFQKQAFEAPMFWHLTEWEKYSLGYALDKIKDVDRFKINIRCLPDANPRTFVEDIAKVFLDHKWNVEANCFFSNVRPDLVGLFIGVSKETNGKIDQAPANARTLARLLDEAGISYGVALGENKKDEFSLVVGNAPFAAH
jgi:hypothetical protein